MNQRIRAEGQNVPPTAEGEPPELLTTGEYFLPGLTSSAEIAYDHVARYRFAQRYVTAKKSIDLGCQAGYGTYALSGFAQNVLGVDLSEEAVAYASSSYRAPNLRYEIGDVTDLPYEDGTFEAAVSFEVIEHLEHPQALVQEASRLLKEDGLFIVSTPDKQTYSNDRNFVDPHHLKEMYPLEFEELLEQHFRHVQIYRQGALAGSIITPDPKTLPADGRATLESTRFSLPEPEFGRETPSTLYMLAVCANGHDAPEPLRRPHLIVDLDRQIYEEVAGLRHIVRLFHAYEQEIVQRQVQEALIAHHERQREMVRRQVQEVLKESRTWRLAQKIKAVRAKAARIFGRRGR